MILAKQQITVNTVQVGKIIYILYIKIALIIIEPAVDRFVLIVVYSLFFGDH
jgi:hypothetical protein